jgi:hypothetical protein
LRPIAILLLAGCAPSAGDGYAVQLTIVHDASVSDTALSTVDTYRFHFSGAESDDRDIAVLRANRTERVLLKLAHDGATLEIDPSALAGTQLVSAGSTVVTPTPRDRGGDLDAERARRRRHGRAGRSRGRRPLAAPGRGDARRSISRRSGDGERPAWLTCRRPKISLPTPI